MSLESDFAASKLDHEAYLRLIWDETELSDDSLSGVDVEDPYPEDIKDALYSVISDGPATPERKTFYQKMLLNYLNGTSLERFCNTLMHLAIPESEKKDQLAQLFMRVLRGELANNQTHRPIVEATEILAQRGARTWRAKVADLIALDQTVQ